MDIKAVPEPIFKEGQQFREDGKCYRITNVVKTYALDAKGRKVLIDIKYGAQTKINNNTQLVWDIPETAIKAGYLRKKYFRWHPCAVDTRWRGEGCENLNPRVLAYIHSRALEIKARIERVSQ